MSPRAARWCCPGVPDRATLPVRRIGTRVLGDGGAGTEEHEGERHERTTGGQAEIVTMGSGK